MQEVGSPDPFRSMVRLSEVVVIVTVTSVNATGPSKCKWTFSQDINILAVPTGLQVDDRDPLSVPSNGTNWIELEYGFPTETKAWDLLPGFTGISVDPPNQLLVPQAGTVA